MPPMGGSSSPVAQGAHGLRTGRAERPPMKGTGPVPVPSQAAPGREGRSHVCMGQGLPASPQESTTTATQLELGRLRTMAFRAALLGSAKAGACFSFSRHQEPPLPSPSGPWSSSTRQGGWPCAQRTLDGSRGAVPPVGLATEAQLPTTGWQIQKQAPGSQGQSFRLWPQGQGN